MGATFIQFTGAQSTGKSSVLKELHSRYPKVQWIGEVSRTLLAGNAITNLDVKSTDMEQMLINAELLYQYYERLKRPSTLIVAERSAICCLAYARSLKNPSPYMLDFTTRFLKATLDRKDYTMITFYFPLYFFVEDGIRNKESAERIDTEIQKILQAFSISHHVVPSLSIEGRADFIEKKTNNFLFSEIL